MKSFRLIVWMIFAFLLGNLQTYSQQEVTGYDAKVDDIYYRLKGDSAIVVYDTSYIGGTGHNPSYSNRTSITIPNSIIVNDKTYIVKSIGRRAFFNCQKLKDVFIPSTISSIGANAFEGCSVLDSVISKIKEPFAIDGNVFFKSGSYIHNQGAPSGMPSNAVLYVPYGTKTLYEKTDGWNQFTSIVETDLEDGDTFTALTEEGVEMEFQIISVSEKSCKVSGIDYRTAGKVTIPSEVNSFRVIEIGNVAFAKCSSITSVIIPNSVEVVGRLAFGNCSSLSDINLPNSLKTIGIGAFQACESLKSIVIPSSVTSIECLSPSGYWENPFSHCKNLESIVVEPGNPIYDSRENCNAIITETSYFSSLAAINKTATIITGCKNTTIPSSVLTIGGYSFAGCGLTHIDIPSNIQYIGSNAFYGNYVEKDNFVNHSALDAENNNYWGCTMLDTTKDGFWITDGELIKYTGNETIITIPSTVTSIRGYVFSGLDHITSVSIPNSVTKIGYGAFYRCSSLKSIKVPNGITAIGDNTFNGCSSLETVIIPYGIKSIGGAAFAGCKNLREVYCYPATCPEMGANVFLDSNIANATLYVLESSSNLYSSTAPWSEFGSIQNIDVAIVQSDNTFTTNTVDDIQMRFKITDLQNKTAEVYGYYVNRTATVREYFPAISQDASKAIIPSSVYTNNGEYTISGISNDAFYGCKMNSIYIPSSISSIGYDAFKQCTSLEKVIIPDIAAWCSVKFVLRNGTIYQNNNPLNIGRLYIDENTEVTELVIPEGVTDIGDYVFLGCSKLLSVKMPASIQSIGKSAFEGCNALEKVIITDVAAWCGVKLSNIYDSPLNFAHHLYSDADNEITELTIPDDVTYITPGAFYHCWYVTKFVMPDGLLSIGENALPFPKLTVGTNIQWHDFYYYCKKGTVGLLAVWNYLAGLTNTYSGEFITRQNAYDAKDRNTKLPYPSISVSTTQTTASINITGIYDEYAYWLNGKPLEKEDINLTELYPGYSKKITLHVNLPGIAYYVTPNFTCERELNTQAINPSLVINKKTASSISVTGSYIHGDAVITREALAICSTMKKSQYADNSAYCSIYNPNAEYRDEYYSNYYLIDGKTVVEGNSTSFYGLDPSTNYYIVYNVYVDQKPYTTVSGVPTDTLAFTTQAAQATSNTKARICALTNVDDDSLRCGFEWRRYDAPDLVPSTLSPCSVFNGVISGSLNNLSSNTYYKYRPYYKSDSEKIYYGDWLAFGTADAYVYFEPEVHTYEAQNVSSNSASLRGYALPGSDDVTEQGFEYWSESNSNRVQTRTIDDGHSTIIASGQLMTVTVENLQPATQYHYRSYVKTISKTTYGEEMTFKTAEDMTVINGVTVDADVKVLGYYNLQGRKITGPKRGIVIIQFSDGSTKKVFWK